MGWTSELPPPAPLQEMAWEYVELVTNGVPDRLNRLVHPVWGFSHRMMWLMQITYGIDEVNAAINREYKARKQ